MQVGRAVVLLAVAVLIGVVLLQHSGSSTTGRIVSSSQSSSVTATSVAPPKTTPSTAPATTITAPLRAPQDIKVLVANGTSTNGLASTVKSKLQAEGYQTLTSTNSSEQVTATIIYYRPGYQNEANAMAQFLNLSPTAVQAMPAQAPVSSAAAASANSANIIVVAGPDVAGGTSGTTGATTTTTRARTTTTTTHR